MSKLPSIYIAGPFRARTAWEIENNIREAEHWGLAVAKLGAVPIIPHSMYRFFHGVLPDPFWIEATLTLLRPCDALLVIDFREKARWQASTGTVGEVEEMRRLGRPRFFLDDFVNGSLAAWIEERMSQ